MESIPATPAGVALHSARRSLPVIGAQGDYQEDEDVLITTKGITTNEVGEVS